MKTKLTACLVGLCVAGWCSAQEKPAEPVAPPVPETSAPPVRPTSTPPAPAVDAELVRKSAESLVFQTEVIRRILGVEVELGGAVKKAIIARNPLQLINPFAPAQYGDGYDNVTVDPDTGRANGIRLLEIRF